MIPALIDNPRQKTNFAHQGMAKHKLKIGDKIQVIGYSPGKYPPGKKDEMGTEKLFKNMVGRHYTIKGFDDHGHIELQPKRHHTVWIEPELVEWV